MAVRVDRILLAAIEWQTDQKTLNSSCATFGPSDKQSTPIPAWWFNAPIEELNISLLWLRRKALGRDGADLAHQFRPLFFRVVVSTAFGHDRILSSTVVGLPSDPFKIVP